MIWEGENPYLVEPLATCDEGLQGNIASYEVLKKGWKSLL